MPKNPTDLSLEILEKVDGFYSKSSVQVTAFYEKSFDILLMYISWIGATTFLFVGVISPWLIFQYLNKRSKESEKRINDLKNHLENSLKESEKRNEEKLSQELKNFHSAFEQEKKNFERKVDEIAVSLKKDIKSSEGSSFIYQVAAASRIGDKKGEFTLLCKAIQAFAESENNEKLNRSLDIILEVMESGDFEMNEVVATAERFLNKLRQHDKKDNSILSKVVSKLEDEIKKTKKS